MYGTIVNFSLQKSRKSMGLLDSENNKYLMHCHRGIPDLPRLNIIFGTGNGTEVGVMATKNFLHEWPSCDKVPEHVTSTSHKGVVYDQEKITIY